MISNENGKLVYGPFISVEEVKKWLNDKYLKSSYIIDIFPVKIPTDYKEDII